MVTVGLFFNYLEGISSKFDFKFGMWSTDYSSADSKEGQRGFEVSSWEDLALIRG